MQTLLSRSTFVARLESSEHDLTSFVPHTYHVPEHLRLDSSNNEKTKTRCDKVDGFCTLESSLLQSYVRYLHQKAHESLIMVKL
jgi:hypothetical protein